MCVHEFGIMQTAPESGRRYDEYEPEKYGCITVDDDAIQSVAKRLNEVKCYWHTLEKPQYGLAYYGTTLIPPSSFDYIIEIIAKKQSFSELLALIIKAKEQNKYIIHFGI